DIRVTAFAAVVSLVTTILFGLVPALQSTRSHLSSALKNEAAAEWRRRWPLRDLLVGVQVALSVVLLAGSVLVIQSLRHALSLPIGFEPQHAAAVSFDLSLQGYDRGRGQEFQRRVLDKVRALPGIESAGLITGLPLTLNINNSGVFIEGKPVLRAADVPSAAMYWVSPGYLRTARTRLVAGRDFDARDREGAPRVAIVNQASGRDLLPGQDPIGKRFRYASTGQEWIQIVGVVENGMYRSLGEVPIPAVFNPLEQFGGLGTSLVARS